MSVYSHSKLNIFEQCPQKFKFRYIDKIKPGIEKTIESHLGHAVHSTLEWIYNTVKEGIKIPNLDEIINYYAVKWQDEFSDEIIIIKKELTAKDYFNKGIQFIKDYYLENYPFKDGTIECEKEICIELIDNNSENENKKYKIKGFIDRLVYNLDTGEYEIHDYKTSNKLPTQEEVDKDRQLALYSIAIKEIHGKDKEVKLVWHYLAHKMKVVSKRTDEQLENLKKETLELIKKIEITKDFPTKKSALCHWCEYKNICPAWDPQININQKQEINDKLSNEKYFKIIDNLPKEELDIW